MFISNFRMLGERDLSGLYLGMVVGARMGLFEYFRNSRPPGIFTQTKEHSCEQQFCRWKHLTDESVSVEWSEWSLYECYGNSNNYSLQPW